MQSYVGHHGFARHVWVDFWLIFGCHLLLFLCVLINVIKRSISNSVCLMMKGLISKLRHVMLYCLEKSSNTFDINAHERYVVFNGAKFCLLWPQCMWCHKEPFGPPLGKLIFLSYLPLTI